MKKSLLNQSLLLLAVLVFATAVNAQSKSPAKNYQPDVSSSQYNINVKDGQQQYKFKMVDDKITELYVDDKKISEENYNKYEEAINRIMIQVKKDKETAELDKQRAEQRKQRAEQDAIQANNNKAKAELDRQNAKQQEVRAQQDQEKAMTDAKHANEDKQTLNELLSDLEKENIVNDSKKVTSLELNDEVLTVNGKKQSDALHSKFKEKYLVKKGARINYSYRNFSISNEQ